MKNKASPNRIRFVYPTIDYLPSTDSYWVDARQHDYPGKKSGQYKLKDRTKALAKAEEIAALVADTISISPNLPSSVLAKLEALGLCPYEILNKALASFQENKQQMTLGEAFRAFEAYKKSEGLRPRALKSVLPEVSKFIQSMGNNDAPLSSIGVAQIDEYLVRHAVSPGSHNTKRKHLSTFFTFCVNREWLDKNPMLKVLRKTESIEVHVTQPKLIESLLNATLTQLPEPASSAMRAYLALAAFAGVRPEEITRLDWSQIHLEQSLIYIPKTVSKTHDDREIPITPNCLEWLRTCANRTGPIQPKSSLASRFLKIRTFCGIETWRKAGEPWPHDVLRHTFASSWLAIHKNRPHLAEIMGNSVGIIAKHYKRTIPTTQAHELFAIFPPDNAAAS